MARKRVEVFYSGSVQGVGFRFTADRYASIYKISGYVKNMPDGGVKIIAEGEEESLKSFLANITGDMRSYIRDHTEDWSPATGEFKDFGIRF